MRRELRGMPVKTRVRHQEIRESFGQGQKTAKKVRADLCARFSTQDQQTLPCKFPMRKYAMGRGWTINLQLNEVGPGASPRQLREN
jgi:hypothetical protein